MQLQLCSAECVQTLSVPAQAGLILLSPQWIAPWMRQAMRRCEDGDEGDMQDVDGLRTACHRHEEQSDGPQSSCLLPSQPGNLATLHRLQSRSAQAQQQRSNPCHLGVSTGQSSRHFSTGQQAESTRYSQTEWQAQHVEECLSHVV